MTKIPYLPHTFSNCADIRRSKIDGWAQLIDDSRQLI